MGCGGIDVLNGGLGFINFDLLVKKLQGILQASPMVAFDLALNVLCEPCAKSIKSIDGIVNALNGLQIDDCQASRALVAYAMEQALPGEEPAKKELGNIVQDFMASSGIQKLGYEVSKSIKVDNDKIPAQAAAGTGGNHDIIAGCPAELKDIFGNPGSFLQNIRTKIKGVSDEQLNLIRGVVGNIEIKPDLVSTAYISPCR